MYMYPRKQYRNEKGCTIIDSQCSKTIYLKNLLNTIEKRDKVKYRCVNRNFSPNKMKPF